MLITFGKTWPDPATTLQRLASANNASVAIAWTRPREIRFKLLAGNRLIPRQASPATHDSFIRAVLEHDPHARVRTAKACFHGLEDFERQYAASLE